MGLLANEDYLIDVTIEYGLRLIDELMFLVLSEIFEGKCQGGRGTTTDAI